MSEHPKVSQQLSDPISENLQKLAALFPAAMKDGMLDVEALREELGDFAEIHPGDEKYELNWVGKQAAKKKTFEPLFGKTLALKDDGKNADTTQNLYIEGDNLEALKLLRQNYYGEVKMIYIDPPYNTGKDFVYTDKFKVSEEESESEEGAVSETGERLVKNEKTSNRFHANWLNMIYPRLKLAKDLLREDGVIFISIDDNEIHNLREICDEIFSETNFYNEIILENDSRARPYGSVATTHEYILCYAKTRAFLHEILYDAEKKFSYTDETGGFDLYELRNRNVQFNVNNRPNLFYPFWVDTDSEDENGLFRISLVEKVGWVKVLPKISQGIQTVWRWGKGKSKENLNIRIYGKKTNTAGEFQIVKTYRENSYTLNSVWADKLIKTDKGTLETKLLFENKKYFDFPKPTNLLKRILKLSTKCDELILDFFSGSATTADAVMQLNAEDGSSRKHIMVQLPELCDAKSEAAKADYKTIAEIGKERIRRAGEKIVEELRAKKAALEKKGELELDDQSETNPYILNPDALDIGFKSFRIEDTKINWLKKDLRGEEFDFDTADISDKDALDFVPGTTDHDVVYELMLRQSNIPLTLPITQPVPTANRTYLYGDAYLICLEEEISNTLVASLAALEPTPLKYFFRDSAFGKDIALKDETFRRLSAEIAKNTADQTDAYTVEFI